MRILFIGAPYGRMPLAGDGPQVGSSAVRALDSLTRAGVPGAPGVVR